MLRGLSLCLLIVLCAGFLQSSSLCAPPAQDPLLRPQICLNGEWQFQPADDALTSPSATGWDKTPIRIPSPWNVNAFSRGNGGDFECFPSYPKSWEGARAAWHRRSFMVPESMQDKAIFLRFDAVMFRAEVYVNGKLAGSHEGGFTPFELNVTDLVKVGMENELVVGVQGRYIFDVNGRTPYGWGSFWGEVIRGIWQDVNLIARPKLYVSDVFVLTSVAKREITSQVQIINLTAEQQSVRLNNHVFNASDAAPGGTPQKGFNREHITLEPGETKTVTLTEPWASPQLWWPDDPHLYVMLTRLYANDEDNTPLDMQRTRFGFKEFKIGEDRKFTLNGVTFSGRGDAWHFMGVPQMMPQYARAWYKMAKSANVNIIRLHAQIYPEFYLDIADEMGMLIVDETALWGSAINFWYDDDFIRRASDHCRELVLRDRNHPSVALWSVANEIYARQGEDNAPSLDWIFAHYAQWAKQMMTLDPTREVSSDGDGDLGGRLNIFSYHYPGAGDPNPGKIATIGEAGSMYYSTPSEVAHAIGDRAYRTSTDRMDAVATETADLIEGYRKWAAYAMPFNLAWYGLEPLPINVKYVYEDLTTPGMKPERLGPYSTMLNGERDPKLPEFIPNPLYYATKDAFEPIRFFIHERNPQVWHEQDLVRHLTVHNDIFEASDLQLEWRYLKDSKLLFTNKKKLMLEPGGMAEVEVVVPKSARGKQTELVENYTLEITLKRGQEVCYKTRQTLMAYSKAIADFPGWFTMGNAVPMVLFDPAGKTITALGKTVKPITIVKTAEDFIKADCPIKIVGANSGLTPEQATRLMDETKGLVVLEGNPGFFGPHGYCTRKPGNFIRAFFNRSADTPLDNSVYTDWGEDGIVARASCGGEVYGSVEPLITCGDGEWAWFRGYDGDRIADFNELELVAKAPTEPAAKMQLNNIISNMSVLISSSARKQNSISVMAAPRSRMAAAMSLLGVKSVEDGTLLLCDGSQPPTDSNKIKATITDNKKSVLVIGLIPETLDSWNKILPQPIALEPSNALQLVRTNPDNLACEFLPQHRNLFWIEQNNNRRIMEFAIKPDNLNYASWLSTNHTDWERWCWKGENIKTGAIVRSELEPFTAKSGLVSIKLDWEAQNRATVSQVRLDPMNVKSMRFYSELLTYLGVTLRRGTPSETDLTPFNMDADGFINAWLMCGPFASKEGHKTDLLKTTEGTGEGLVRPEVGFVSGNGIWGTQRSGGPAVDFTKLFGKLSDQVIYTAAWVKAPSEMTVNLWLGSDDSVKVWLNDKLVHDQPGTRPCVADADKISGLKLQSGWNLLVFKVTQGSGEWGLTARLVDDKGKALEGLEVSTKGPSAERKWEQISRKGWAVTTSQVGEAANNAIDNDVSTRWSTGDPQKPGQWFQLDLGHIEKVSRLVLDSTGSPQDWPRGLKLEGSTDGKNWTLLCDCPNLASAPENGVVTLIFPEIQARYLKMSQTGTTGVQVGLWWSIHELFAFR